MDAIIENNEFNRAKQQLNEIGVFKIIPISNENEEFYRVEIKVEGELHCIENADSKIAIIQLRNEVIG